MAITSNAYTIGTALVQIVDASSDAQHVLIQNQEPVAGAGDQAREGYLYTVASRFTVPQGGTTSFGITTGTAGLQIQAYELVSKTSAIEAQLVEGATVSTTGAAIPVYNMNRNESDVIDAEMKAATAVTGGSAVSKEYLTADKHSSSGGKGTFKILTLKPSSTYAFRFINLENQNSEVFFQAAFSEKYSASGSTSADRDVWIGNTAGSAYKLRAGETLSLPMLQAQTLTASANGNVTIGVLRQD